MTNHTTPGGSELTPLQHWSDHLAALVERVSPALVHVQGRPRRGSSGTIFAPDLVITADHTLQQDDDIAIRTHDGRQLTAQIAGRDPSSDLAVLRVPGLGSVPIAPATTPPRVGQVALAVTRPGNSVTASLGIVSTVGGPLQWWRGPRLEQFIRTDASLYPGASGGALLDASGQVLGIITTGAIRGFDLVIPAAIAWRTAESLSANGFVARGYLGILGQSARLPQAVREARSQRNGLLVIGVESNSPAERAGLLLGDVIVGFDGSQVDDIEDLQTRLTAKAVGDTVSVDVLRAGGLTTVSVTIGQRQRATA